MRADTGQFVGCSSHPPSRSYVAATWHPLLVPLVGINLPLLLPCRRVLFELFHLTLRVFLLLVALVWPSRMSCSTLHSYARTTASTHTAACWRTAPLIPHHQPGQCHTPPNRENPGAALLHRSPLPRSSAPGSPGSRRQHGPIPTPPTYREGPRAPGHPTARPPPSPAQFPPSPGHRSPPHQERGAAAQRPISRVLAQLRPPNQADDALLAVQSLLHHHHKLQNN